MRKTSNKKGQSTIDVSNLVPRPATSKQILSSESLLSPGRIASSFTYENCNNSNIPVTK